MYIIYIYIYTHTCINVPYMCLHFSPAIRSKKMMCLPKTNNATQLPPASGGWRSPMGLGQNKLFAPNTYIYIWILI